MIKFKWEKIMNTAKDYKQINNELISELRKHPKDSSMYAYILNKIMQINEPLIRHATKKYVKREDYEDIVAEMRLSILQSVESYDPNSKNTFANYAMTNMQFNISLYSRNASIMKPNTNILNKLSIAKKLLLEEGILFPTEEQLLQKANIPQKDFSTDYFFGRTSLLSLDYFTLDNDGRNNDNIVERIQSNENIAEWYNQKETFELLHLAITYLPEKQQQLITKKYLEEKSTYDTASELNFTLSNTSEHTKKAISNLKQLLGSQYLNLITKHNSLQNYPHKDIIQQIRKSLTISQLFTLLDIISLKYSSSFAGLKIYDYSTLQFSKFNDKTLSKAYSLILKKDLNEKDLTQLKKLSHYAKLITYKNKREQIIPTEEKEK